MTVPSPARRFVDLHAHSTASDGTREPAEVVAAARAAALEAIALTDHDTLGGVPAALSAGAELGVRVVAGVELSAFDGEDEVHILGLHVSVDGALQTRLAAFGEARRSRAEEIVTRLNSLSVPVRLQSVLDAAGGGVVGRPHVARALVAGGWVRDHREAFDRYLGAGRPAYVPKLRLEIHEAIEMVHDAGGLAVFAHPGEQGTRARVERLTDRGLDGLEVRHPSHSLDDVERLSALAAHFRLVPSGGSDWHGAAEGQRTIGNMRVPAEWLERQDARLAARGAGAHAGAGAAPAA